MRTHKALYAPVVMMVDGVVMNGALVPVSEYRPKQWVGKPVTLGHPTDSQGFRAAEASDAVGVIATAWVEDGKLKATLKLDDDKVGSHVRRLIEDEERLDVSTGYFSVDEAGGGHIVSRDLAPDHLALLPGEAGACSWQDGCGLRAQVRGNKQLHVNNCCTECNMTNMDDPGHIRAALIADPRSPFTPASAGALATLNADTLRQLRDGYLGGHANVVLAVNAEDLATKAITTNAYQTALAGLGGGPRPYLRDQPAVSRYVPVAVPRANIAVNADDPALRAMSSGADLLREERAKQSRRGR